MGKTTTKKGWAVKGLSAHDNIPTWPFNTKTQAKDWLLRHTDGVWLAYWRGTSNRVKMLSGEPVRNQITQGLLRRYLLDQAVEHGVIIEDLKKPLTEADQVRQEGKF